MSEHQCPGCSEPIRDEGVICWPCSRRLAGQLRSVPDLLAELETTATRQSRMGDPAHTSERRLPFDPRADDVARTLTVTVVGWVRVLIEDSGRPELAAVAETVGTAVWLSDNINSVRMRDWADTCRSEVLEATRAGWRAVDRPPERWFSGYCQAETDDPDQSCECRCHAGPQMCDQDGGCWRQHRVVCGAPLYAREDRADIKCRTCGAIWDVLECRAWLLDAAEDRLETAGTISRALTRLSHPVTSKAIYQWRERGKLSVAGKDAKGRETYRLGDVAALVRGQMPRHAEVTG